MDSSEGVKVAALMTAPRYEAVSARNQIEKALNVNGNRIPMEVSGGVYYGQCMQKMMESLIGKADYILTVDFDSIFTEKHVVRLLSIIAQEKDIDAIAALQPMRGAKRMLGSTYEGGELQWKGYPLKVDTAHFGLTVIDVEKLESVPKPWFFSQPGADGTWGDDRIDDDVWFWRQWEKAGHSCYIDPGCRLGHMEELVSVYDRQMNLQRIYMKDWIENASDMVD